MKSPRLGADLFRRIYDTEAPYVFNFIRRLGISQRDLEDKVHDVFVVMYRRWSDYDPDRPIRWWLRGIAVRVVSDYHRRSYRKREVMRDEVQAVAAGDTPEAAAERKQGCELVLAALDTMSLDRRAVFVLHEIEGLSIPEIAQTLDAPINTLYSRLRLAREQFTAAIRRQRNNRGENG